MISSLCHGQCWTLYIISAMECSRTYAYVLNHTCPILVILVYVTRCMNSLQFPTNVKTILCSITNCIHDIIIVCAMNSVEHCRWYVPWNVLELTSTWRIAYSPFSRTWWHCVDRCLTRLTWGYIVEHFRREMSGYALNSFSWEHCSTM